MDQFENYSQGRLHSGDAEGRQVVLYVLLLETVGGVVAGNAVYDPLGQGFYEGLAVLLGPEGGINFGACVVTLHGVMGEGQVVGGYLAGDMNA